MKNKKTKKYWVMYRVSMGGYLTEFLGYNSTSDENWVTEARMAYKFDTEQGAKDYRKMMRQERYWRIGGLDVEIS